MKMLELALQNHSYPIYIGDNIRLQPTLLQKHIASDQIMIISNPSIAQHYLVDLQKTLSSYQVDHHLIPDGEQYKTLEYLNTIFDALLQKNHRRNTTLIALGGGVIGDMTGFAAACYQRGAHFIQIPTSLLAQVDASVGGKTAINHPLGKNMIGAFYQPDAVFIDIATLNTLPTREFHAGLAEIIKHALILDADFFAWLEKHMPLILKRNTEKIIEMIFRSCQIKAKIVIQDEREQLGMRQLLNFGHTFGHALETALNYEYLLHGEAVAIGMMLAASLSQDMGFITKNDYLRIKQLLHEAHLPTTFNTFPDAQTLLEYMKRDKKNWDQHITCILLKRIGQAMVTSDIENAVFLKTLAEFVTY